jgi:tetratricopeptide (TPR) repeat protein
MVRYLRLTAILLLGSFALSAAKSAVAGAGAEYARVDHPISSKIESAQAYFNQGLTLLFAFSRPAARRAFQRAVAADPHSAIAYWGIAMTYGANINFPQDEAGERLGYAAVRKALALSADANPSERDYIKALAARYTGDHNPHYEVLARAYHDAMRALARKYPNDLDAATLFAESGMDLRPWDLYAIDGTPRPGTNEIVATLETVLKKAPGHIGANHFYVHATEASSHPERGLESAGRLASRNFEPAAAHLTHMPAHTFARTGYYQEASAINVLATKSDRAYLRTGAGKDPEAQLYYGHDLAFLAYADEMDGNLGGALGAEAQLNTADYQVPAMFALLRFERWHDILALPHPKANPLEPMRLMFWRFARGMAFAETGNLAAATRERNAMIAVGSSLHVPAVFGYTNSSDALLRVADDVLAAKIAVDRNDTVTAIANLRAAVSAQDHLIYIEPPDWYYPARESLGAALLRAGHPAQAAKVFRADLARNPRNPRSLFGLSKSLAAMGDVDDAKNADKEFRDSWKAGTVTLTVQSL